MPPALSRCYVIAMTEAEAGVVAAAWYGDWHRGAFTPASKEIIAVTRRAG